MAIPAPSFPTLCLRSGPRYLDVGSRCPREPLYRLFQVTFFRNVHIIQLLSFSKIFVGFLLQSFISQMLTEQLLNANVLLGAEQSSYEAPSLYCLKNTHSSAWHYSHIYCEHCAFACYGNYPSPHFCMSVSSLD